MGRKITIDSATLMNKGLEVIEAHWLFGVRRGPDRRRDSSAVGRALDGRARGRIAHRAAGRHRHAAADSVRVFVSRALGRADASLDLVRAGRLEFEAPDTEAFPCLRLAYRALEAERSLPVVLNAANEIAVAQFLEGRIGFTAIPQVIEGTMDAHRPAEVATLAAVREVDHWARQYARELARAVELKV